MIFDVIAFVAATLLIGGCLRIITLPSPKRGTPE